MHNCFMATVQQDSTDVIIMRTVVTDRLNELGYTAYNVDTETDIGPILESFDWISFAGNNLVSHTTICAET